MASLLLNDHESKKDRKIALLSAIIFFIVFIFISIILKFTINPPLPVDLPPLKSDEVIEEFIVENVKIYKEDEGSEGQSGGTSSDDKLDDPKPQTENILTQNIKSDNTAFSGKSDNTNTENNNTNTSTSTSPSPNPFGSGGSGGGNKGGRGGHGFGNDDGEGVGSGNGNGSGGNKPREPRIRLNEIESVESNQSGAIYILVTINAEGNVIKAVNLNNETTITDQRIIQQVIANVKSQVKYNKKPGTTPQTQRLRIDVKAT